MSKTSNSETSQDSRSNDGSEHYFVPLSGAGLSRHVQDNKINSLKSRQLFTSQADSSLLQTHTKDNNIGRRYSGVADTLNDLDSLDEFDGMNSFLSAGGSNSSVSDAHRSFYDMDEVEDQVFSPPLLMDTALLADSYEDLLGMSYFTILTRLLYFAISGRLGVFCLSTCIQFCEIREAELGSNF